MDPDQQQSRGELYLCLARAFMTPDSADNWSGLRDALADDLDELNDLLGLGGDAQIAGYRAAIAGIADHAALLQTYAALFLAPPRRVDINTGAYLDGAINGGSVLAMENAYRHGGVQRSDDFKDLADHVSVQLEFVGYRFLASIEAPDTAREAEEFLDAFVARWLPPFIADMEGEAIEPNPWLHLARLLSMAVAQDARAADTLLSAAQLRRQEALGRARHVRAQNEIGEDDMAFIAQRLREKGLAVDHLAIPPEQRDEMRGWTRKVPPSPRRGSRLG